MSRRKQTSSRGNTPSWCLSVALATPSAEPLPSHRRHLAYSVARTRADETRGRKNASVCQLRSDVSASWHESTASEFPTTGSRYYRHDCSYLRRPRQMVSNEVMNQQTIERILRMYDRSCLPMTRGQLNGIVDRCSSNATDSRVNEHHQILRGKDVSAVESSHSDASSQEDTLAKDITSIVVNDLEEIIHLSNTTIANSNVFVASHQKGSLLYDAPTQNLQANGKRRHSLYVTTNGSRQKIRSMRISVVFNGSFVGQTYHPGEISVVLVHYKSDDDLHPSTIGCIESDTPNTMEALGFIIIRHEIPHTTVEDGLYEVVVSAKANTNYSISLSGKIAVHVSEEVKNMLVDCIVKKNELEQCIQRASSLDAPMAILRRKLTIENNLLCQATKECDEREVEIERLELELDYRDDMKDGGASIEASIKALETEYMNWSKTLANR